MLTSVFTGATIFAVFAALWSRVRVFIVRAYQLIWVEDRAEGEAGNAVRGYISKHFARSPFGSRLYGARYEHVRSARRTEVIAWEEHCEEPRFFWKGWRPILVSYKPEAVGGQHQNSPMSWRCNFSYIRGTFRSDELVRGAVREFNDVLCGLQKQKSNRFHIRRVSGMAASRTGGESPRSARDENHLGSGPDSNFSHLVKTGQYRLLTHDVDDVGPARATGKAIDHLSLSDDVMRAYRDVGRWLKSEAWFTERGLIWTRGLLGWGKPGNGKTRTIRAIAEDYDLPLFTFDLGSLSNREFTEALDEVRRHAPCMMLMEDLECVFHGRVNVTGEKGGGLTFDCLLNGLGGVNELHGVYKVATTNDISKLDPALGVPTGSGSDTISTRPGRFDIAIEFTPPDLAAKRKIADRLLRDWPYAIPETLAKGTHDSGAQFVFRCSELATSLYWQQVEAEERRQGGGQGETLTTAVTTEAA